MIKGGGRGRPVGSTEGEIHTKGGEEHLLTMKEGIIKEIDQDLLQEDSDPLAEGQDLPADVTGDE